MRAALFPLLHIANNELNTTYTPPPPPRPIGPVLQGVQYVSTSYALCLFMLVSVIIC